MMDIVQGQGDRSRSQKDSLARECWLRAQAGLLGTRWPRHVTTLDHTKSCFLPVWLSVLIFSKSSSVV